MGQLWIIVKPLFQLVGKLKHCYTTLHIALCWINNHRNNLESFYLNHTFSTFFTNYHDLFVLDCNQHNYNYCSISYHNFHTNTV